VEKFWVEFAGVTCNEDVAQLKLGPNGKVLAQLQTTFDYLVLMHMKGNDLSVDESRLVQRQSGAAKNQSLLKTSGFSTLVLVFHPFFQNSFEYLKMEDEVLDGKRMLRMKFRHVRGTRSPSVLQLHGRDYPLDLEGIAWIDPDSGSIARITATLSAPMDDVGLKSLQSEVRYAPQHFPGIAGTYWLPVTAQIEVETPRQHWRNLHRFVNYRRFTVETRLTPN
jgi:hypothetical protein